MADRAKGEHPAGTADHRCPLPGCGWTFTQPPPPAPPDIPVINGESLEQAIGRASLAGLQEWYAEAERVVEAHLGGHTTLEWVTEVARLNGIIAELLASVPHDGRGGDTHADLRAGEPAALTRR